MIELVTENDIKSEGSFTIEAYYRGFRILLTHPFENGQSIVGLLDKMTAAGFTPKLNGELPVPTTETNDSGKVKEIETHMFPVHNVEMKKWEKDNKVWYSHKVDGGWCTGKKN